MAGFGPLFPEIPATTLNELLDGYIWQNSYISTPLQRYFRASGAYNPFGGGAAMQVPQLYAGAQGGAIYPGQDVTVNRVQMLTAGLFQPRLYTKYILVEEFGLSVMNKGPEAKIKILETYLEQMMQGIDFQIEGDMFRHGQAAGNGVSDNRLASINGISEACNDGVTPSWDGNFFPTYSGQARNGAIGSALNSIPIWLGDQSGNPAPPNYQSLLRTYMTPIGRPTIGVTSYLGYAAIATAFQRQQRYEAVLDQNINWSGIKFEDATIFEDDIVPSSNPKASIANLFTTVDGTAPAPGAIQTGQFVITQANLANQGTSLLPNLGFTSTATPLLTGGLNTIVVGEPLFWLDVDIWEYRPSDAEDFNYHMMDPIRYPQNPTLYTQFLRHSLNFYTPTPRRHQQCYGIKG
ncbi:MAG: hypothetical protein KGL39_19225 [Patescibacteria group bacterium]|nr:hypothetical protein [Patescibacteria group bacterium]